LKLTWHRCPAKHTHSPFKVFSEPRTRSKCRVSKFCWFVKDKDTAVEISHSMPCSRICVLQFVAVCCSVLQCVAVCCSVLQCAAVKDTDTAVEISHSMPCCRICALQPVAVCCGVLQCVVVCWSVLQWMMRIQQLRLATPAFLRALWICMYIHFYKFMYIYIYIYIYT